MYTHSIYQKMDILIVSAYVTEPGNRDYYTQKLLLYYMTGFVKTMQPYLHIS